MLLGLILKFKKPAPAILISLKIVNSWRLSFIFVAISIGFLFIFFDNKKAILVDKSPNSLFLGTVI